jgi:HD-like signal output (HDOD) protein
MSLFLIVIPALLFIVIVLGIALLKDRSPPKPPPAAVRQKTQSAPKAAEAAADAAPAHSTEATERAKAECYKLAFGISHFDYKIGGVHEAVLKNVAASIEASVHQRDYFPRRPMLLPKLMQALNDSESTRSHLVRLILEDPTLAGSVLQRANSAFYRISPEPVENIHRAVAILGTEGLRGLMAAAILQPVFRVPRGYFESFATVTWAQAELTASAAEKCAKATPGVDPFVAQLLGLLTMLANIVLFRLTMDKYRDQPNILPRAEVFITALQVHRGRMAGLIATTWELTDISQRALKEHEERVAPGRMSPLGRCIYYGELCGALATLAAHGQGTPEEAQALLQAQGLDPKLGEALWNWTVTKGGV